MAGPLPPPPPRGSNRPPRGETSARRGDGTPEPPAPKLTTRSATRHRPPTTLARARARVPRVERAVRDAVEAERDEAGAGEREHYEPERAPRDGSAIGGHDHAEQRQRQRENRMREPDEVRVTDQQRLAGERLALAAGWADRRFGGWVVHPAIRLSDQDRF